MGLRSTSGYRKCAGVVGEALAKYHPHGDVALYDALVRLAQDFSLRYPLVDGQGNFGSIDGDPAAAYRYTEARLAAISDELLADIERDTVDFVDNFDGRLQEPTVLPGPAAQPAGQRLVGDRGRHGHQHPAPQPGRDHAGHREAHRRARCHGRRARARSSPGRTSRPAARYSATRTSAPFAGEKERIDAIRHMYATGRGRIVMRGQVAFEEIRPGRMAVVITELPYQVNKTTLIEKMADQVGGKKLTDVSDIRDESDRDGMRIVVEVKRDGSPHTVMSQLFKHTQLESSFSREHAGPGRRAAADAGPQADARALHRIPARRRPATDRVRSGEGQGARPHPRRSEDRARPPRRGDRDHPQGRRRGRRPGRPYQDLHAERDPGQRHPRDAAPAAGGPRAQEDRGRVRGAHPGHRRPGGPARQPAQDPRRHQDRVGGPAHEVRRGTPDDGSATTPTASCPRRTWSPRKTWS